MSLTLSDPLAPWRDRLSRLRAEPSTDNAGDPARLGRVERTRVEMLAQGAAISATLHANAAALDQLAADIRVRPPRAILILGCGDSWFIGMAAAPVIEAATGIPCLAIQAFEHAHFSTPALNRSTLAIGISAGGNTAAVMDALARTQAQGGRAIGMTNTPGSPITMQFDGALIVEASRKGWPTQSSTAAIALLASLAARAATGPEPTRAVATALETLPNATDEAMGHAFEAMRKPAAAIADRPLVLFAGAGPDHAVAAFGAAKLRELSSVHAMALPLEEMHHYRLPKEGDAVVIAATVPEARERALDTAVTARDSSVPTIAILSRPDPQIAALVDHIVLIEQATGPLGVVPAMTAVHALAYHAALARSAAGLNGPFG
jgi:glucosamine--fructose-6-phosphate aminotransferase (isomerizing)